MPSADGNNILHGSITWYDEAANAYGGFGSFAAKANAVAGSQMDFTVAAPILNPTVVARKIFYNQSYYDGNKATIDAAPLAGLNNDDADAIDTSKSALLPSAGPRPSPTGPATTRASTA